MATVDLLGKTVMGYQVVEELGNGSFGKVYRVVKDNQLGHYERALKHIQVLDEEKYHDVLLTMGGDEQKTDAYFDYLMKMVSEEVRTLSDLSSIDSPHIVRYYESDLVQDEATKTYDVYLLMEYLTPFGRFEKLPDSFTVADVMHFALQVLDGIGFCHDHGVIHRDIKEENIFVTKDGTYKIGDFGIAKDVSSGNSAMSMKGTPSSIAPEVYLEKGEYTRSVDLYSLGMVLYRLLNFGRNPFVPPFPQSYLPKDEQAAFSRRLSGAIPNPPALGGERIGEVIVQSLKNQANRFRTARAFSNALRSAIDETSPDVLSCRIHDASSIADKPTLPVGLEMGSQNPPNLEDDERETVIKTSSQHQIGSLDDLETVVGLQNQINQSTNQIKQHETSDRLTEQEWVADLDNVDDFDDDTSKDRLLRVGVIALVIVMAIALGGIAGWFWKNVFRPSSIEDTEVSSGMVNTEESELEEVETADSPESPEVISPEFPNPYQGRYGTWTDGVYVSKTLGIRIEPKGVIQPYYNAANDGDYPDFVYAHNYGDQGWGVATMIHASDLDGVNPATLESTIDGSSLQEIMLGGNTWYQNSYEVDGAYQTEILTSIGGEMVSIRITDPTYGPFTKLFLERITAA